MLCVSQHYQLIILLIEDVERSYPYSCFYEHLKLRFYSSFTALYSRSKSSHSELVSV